ncbi:O-antigen ligase family protein [Clostridium perfringens]|nr:O-antigen ligase family protein [Clostridium perfringens]MDK0577457.1 O-antigen ligase family protein [Clostridium perfringens]MDK0580399.1 O-antigen ligase family protein [Clostridium perfringens]
MIFEYKRISEKIIWCLTVVLISSFYILDLSKWGSIILVIITISIFSISTIANNGITKFSIKQFHLFILLFALFCIFSSLWAIYPKDSFQKGITIIKILICMTILEMYYSKFNSIKNIINAVMWAGFVVVLYAIMYYGLDRIKFTLASGSRLESSFANINLIAIGASISILIMVYNIFFIEKKRIYLVVFAIPSIIMVAASGSRKALMLSILGVVMIVLFRYTTRSFFITLFRWILLSSILLIVLVSILSLPIFSNVNERMNGLISLITNTGVVDHSAWIREQYINFGIIQFTKTPFIGLGIGNSHFITIQVEGLATYLHNNYVELLSCGGIIGFTIYYYIYVYLFYSIFKLRKYKSDYTLLCIILMIILLIMDYGMVTYYSKITYFYFLIFFMEVQLLKKRKIQFNKQV